ncbi:DNA repair exonuclease [Hyphomicrobium sp. D-2]|uniref:metallophosphoesterase family protein n=1 Tax=Hyphomicrobium sp. D-2 TaxID=3041621 RepID=UPI0024566323|nr:DNA repair exonuclease [Hyphomicrobium sp. D-2]MDH4982684.1 DNA repair exonuclease [Hyphomicrobium sp. D-2]
MSIAFLHTADWQLGKRFGSFPGDKPAILRNQRLEAVDRLARAAVDGGCSAVLVAGDIFDAETVPQALTSQLLARLKSYPSLVWHLLPGNHDPARTGGVWTGILASGLPQNVRVHMQPVAAELVPGAVVLPAPLASKRVASDPTAWMDDAPSADGVLRIGLAHGSVQGFGSAGEASVPINPARVRSAGLAYLALGDWHGTMRISDHVWYSGTPEPDGFRDNNPGNALIVRVDGAGPPKVEQVATGNFKWSRRVLDVGSADALDVVEQEVAALGSNAMRSLVSLQLSGGVTLAEFVAIEARLSALEPALFHLNVNRETLNIVAAETDLGSIATPVLADIAQRLKLASEAGGDTASVAQRALHRLFSLAREVENSEGRAQA